jgi:undecaprenyl-diphosphatase
MAELGKRKKESEKNETPFNAISVGIFKVLSIIPGFSGLGGMYFAGLTNGFTKEFAFKFSYILTLVAMILSFIKGCIGLFGYINITHSVLSYILACIGALVTSYFALPVTEKAFKKEHLKYFGTYNIIIAVFTLIVWMRG